MPIKKTSSNPLDRFDLATDAIRPRIIGVSQGEVGTGKTHFWLTAPGPIVVFSLDKGLEGVVEPFTTDKEIRIREYDWFPPPVNDDTEEEDRKQFQTEAQKIRDQFVEDLEIACQHARTVLLDKETDIWELFRYAEFGAPNDAPRNYPALNQRMRRVINLPKALDINFGCIQGMKDEWGTKVKGDGGTKGFNTGRRIPQGFSELEGLVHVVLTHRRENGHFFIDVGKSRGPGALEVQDSTYEDISFADLGQMIYPDTDKSDWS